MKHRIEPLAGLPLRCLVALTSIVLTSLLITGAAAAAGTAPAAPAPNPSHGDLTLAEAEPEEEVEWEWSEEEEEEEVEEVEWPSEEGEEEIEVELEFHENAPPIHKAPWRPAECAVQSIGARVVASEIGDTLHLSLRYASQEPVRVEVHYRPEDGRNTTNLGPTTLRPADHGRVDYTEHPGSQRMSRLRATRTLVVTVEMAGASRGCRRYTTKRLTAKQHGPAQTVWSEAPRHPRSR